jgi:23S rRNA (adenine2503-C2)-methyltransferase
MTTPLPYPDPLAMTHAAFADAAAAFGVSRERALAAYASFFRTGSADEHRLPFPMPAVPQPVQVHASQSPEGEVRKFLLRVPRDAESINRRAPGTPGDNRLPDDLETESVIIPMAHRGGRSFTLCVSSQVGCAMGCRFCETAQMGLIRSLHPREIVAQWLAATHALGASIKNIVFMGMGEPLDNPHAVLDAIAVLTDHRGPAVPMKNITISTVGRLDGLALLAERIRQDGWKRLNLAVSVNAPNDEIRSSIMPINRAMPLGELIPVLANWPMRSSSAICCEYVLIPGVNDAPEHADELAALLKPVRCCVNVIPYNPRRDSPWPAPTEEATWAFLRRLESHGQFCKYRRTKGRETMAACGQLGNEKIRGRRLVGLTIGNA